MNRSSAPKAGALPDCATPRRGVSLSGGPVTEATANCPNGNERRNTAGTDAKSPEIVPDLTPISRAEDGVKVKTGESFLAQLRRVNTERYEAWVTVPLMLCEHCGRDQGSATASGHNFCIAPFDYREHSFTREHPTFTVRNDAGIQFDAVELGGEVGELLNVVKKLVREEAGWRGSRASPQDFADECADVLICLDKLARRRGVDLEAATVAKFNATSEKQGFPHRLQVESPA